MKRKTITLVIYMLVCISLVSVGFAAWVITGGDNTEATGNVTASTVTDKSLSVTDPEFEAGYQNINFGSPVGVDPATTTTKWFQFDTADPENLVAKYSFTLSVGDNNAKLSESLKQVKLTYTDSAVDDLISRNYVKAPMFSAWWGTATEASPCVTPTAEAGFAAALLSALTTGTNAVTGSSVKIYIKIEYDWGSVFNNLNPYEFFNGTVNDTPITGSTIYSGNQTYKDLAIEALGAIDNAFQTAAEESSEVSADYEYTMILNFESVSAQ
jgi:flagellar basal body-associated protein FliL